LTQIELNQGLESIDKTAFFGCESLQRIVIPSNIKVIDTASFSFCYELIEIVLPEGLIRIKRMAFRNYLCWGIQWLHTVVQGNATQILALLVPGPTTSTVGSPEPGMLSV
jgi:hypothetical protein